MKTYYLLSGTDKIEGFYNSVIPYLKKDIANNYVITFITSSFDEYDKNDFYYNNMIKFFNDIDIYFKDAYLIDSRKTKEEVVDYINKSNVVYIMGGNPEEEMKSIKQYNLIEPLKNFKGIIIGVSAGSINMNENVCYVDENDEILQYSGIGLTNYNIAPHLNFNNKAYLEEIFRVSKIKRTIALPNESFIRIEDGKEEIVGEHYYFDNGNIES